jgi:hypothetical protein
LEQQTECDDVFKVIWTRAKEKGLKKSFSKLRSFLPKKSSKFPEILGEICRLWESYRPGLFQYRHFPKPIKTNNDCEVSFSRENQKLMQEAGKGVVSHQIQTRGEVYLRIAHCHQWELEEDIVRQYSEEIITSLRSVLQRKISAVTINWKQYEGTYFGYEEVLRHFYPNMYTEQENREEEGEVN